MTVSTNPNPRYTFNGDGATLSFPFNSYFIQPADIAVATIDALGVVSTKTLGVDYTITGTTGTNGTYPTGATIVFSVAPAAGLTVVLYLDPVITQLFHLIEGGVLPLETLETSIDRLTMIARRLKERADRSFRMADSYTGAFNPVLPASALLANQVMMVSPDGTTFAAGPTAAQISAAQANATAAATSATSAAASAATATSQSADAAASAAAAAAYAGTNNEPKVNRLYNSNFDTWQRGLTPTVANGVSGYGPDRWYVKNGLGTGGIITMSRVISSTAGSRYRLNVKITTAPTAAQANVCELYQTLDNIDSLPFYGQNASFWARIRAIGNVSQIGIQFYYRAGTVQKVDTAIGSEVLTTVDAVNFADCKIQGQAMGTGMGTLGSIGVRIRPTAVTTGNLWDLNNGFLIERAIATINPNTPVAYAPMFASYSEEVSALERFYEKSYNLETDPGTFTPTGAVNFLASGTNASLSVPFRVRKRTPFAGLVATIYSPVSTLSGKMADITAAADVTSTLAAYETVAVPAPSAYIAGHLYQFHWVVDAEI